MKQNITDDNQQVADPFLDAVRNELDRSCDALDGQTLSRLNAMRHAALEQKPGKRFTLLFPFGGLVSACVLVLTVSLLYRPGLLQDERPVISPLEDLEILSDSESLDFFEDYEFYQWLAENGASV